MEVLSEAMKLVLGPLQICELKRLLVKIIKLVRETSRLVLCRTEIQFR